MPMASAFRHRLTEYPFGLKSLGCGQICCLLLFELGPSKTSKKETKKLQPAGYVKACDYCVPTVRDHCCYSGHPFVSDCDIRVDNLVSGSAEGSSRSHRPRNPNGKAPAGTAAEAATACS